MMSPMAGRVLTVAIVEDDSELRATFAQLVDAADNLRLAGAYASAEAALPAVLAAAPDVVMMDIGLPGMSGIECVLELKPRLPDTQFVMLTTYDDTESVFTSLQAGATGYVLKRARAEQIHAAILEVADGGAPMSAAVALKVVQYFGRQRPAAEVTSLSPRERAVLAALGEGMRYKEVAEALGISMNTVRSYIKSAYEKLHVTSRAEAVRKLGRQ